MEKLSIEICGPGDGTCARTHLSATNGTATGTFHTQELIHEEPNT